VISTLAEYQPYEEAAFLVMHELGVAVVECLEKKDYLERADLGPGPVSLS
jgi:hypothetical protein